MTSQTLVHQYADAFAEKVQAHGVLGIAVWRDECLREGLAHTDVADPLKRCVLLSYS